MHRSCTLLGSALLAFVFAGECVADGIVREHSLDFTLPALRGGAPVRLAEYRNKIVYVDVWASWCAPCLKSMPELEALREKFRGQPFEVVGVNVDHDAAAARAMLKGIALRYVMRRPGAGRGGARNARTRRRALSCRIRS